MIIVVNVIICYILLCSVAGILVGVLYMVLLYGLYVPDWNFGTSSLSITQPTLLGANSQTVSQSVGILVEHLFVKDI